MSEAAGDTAGPRQDWRLVPCALAAWAAMGVATWGDGRLTLALAAVALVIAVVAGWRRAWRVVLAALVVVACLASGGAQTWVRDAHPLAAAGKEKAMVVVEADVAGEPRLVPARGHNPALRIVAVTVSRLETRGSTWSGRVPAVVIAKDDEAWRDVVVGARIKVGARAGPSDPGDRSVASLKPTSAPQELAPPGPGMAFVERLRAGLRDAVRPLWPEARALVPALVVGDVSALPEELSEQFRATALTHLTAVSGPNNNPCMGRSSCP